jgi:ribose/xylose/arabinose/galactoside ABC-type transport system permease subunit
MIRRLSMARTSRHADTAGRALMTVLIFAVLAATVPGFASSGDMYSILNLCAPVGLLALGVGATMLAGEIDLSAGASATCLGILAVQVFNLGLVPAIAIAIGIGAVYGAVQGILIAWLRIPSVVFTLGSMIALGGVAELQAPKGTVSVNVAQLETAASLTNQLWIFSPLSITFLVATVGVGLLLGYTRIGREVYAVGGGRAEARVAGVAESRPIVMVFVLAGALAGLAGGMASLDSGSGGPGAYSSFLFQAITAALIGGVSVYGGRGRVLGIILGVLTLQFLLGALALLSAPFWAADLATGVLLLIFLIVELAQEQSPARRALERARIRWLARELKGPEAPVSTDLRPYYGRGLCRTVWGKTLAGACPTPAGAR